MVVAGRLRDIMDRSTESTEGKKEPFKNGDISFENVVFRYGNRAVVLNDLSMDIKQGQHVAIVGTSGCGKTTVTKLLLKFYTPESGHIKIDGKNIEDIPVEELKMNIAYVPQETLLFSDTIRNNLLITYILIWQYLRSHIV